MIGKVGHKARRNRRRNPIGHTDHHKRPKYEREARLLKQRVAARFAPTIDDFEHLRPAASGVHIHRGRAGETADPLTHGG